MDNGHEASSVKATSPRKSSFEATIRFVKEKRSRDEHLSVSSKSSDEESGVELERPSNVTKKRSSSWRLAAMFTKSQNNPKPDKAPSKQSVFPNNGNILKKKARSTILSVLSKRQTQEKLFLGERPDVRNQNSSFGSSEPTLDQTKWPSEATKVDLASTKPNPQRLSSVGVNGPSYQDTPSNQGWASPDSINNEQDYFSSRAVERAEVTQAGLDVLDGNTKVGKLSSRWPPQPRNPDSEGESLGWRRASAPKLLSCPPEMERPGQGSEAKVVSMSPSYTSVKDITRDTPSSPKSEVDSVKVSIPFQVQGQSPQQAAKPEQRSDAWSSSVSICVPFQVNENGDGVSVLPSEPSLPVDSSRTVKSLLGPNERTPEDERDGRPATKPRAQSSPQTGRRKPPQEAHPRDKRATKESPKNMGKEASKHKTTEKAVSSTALKVPTGGKQRSKSFNAGDRPRMSPSPTGTPKSSPGNSPKPTRRNAMSKDMNKKRPSERRKQEIQGRPHSDPLITEKINNKKKSTGVAANDASATGKSKADIEGLKNRVKDLEKENNELKEKMQPMEHKLAIVPLLEKEKLHLQKQFNEIIQENETRKSELESIQLSSQKQSEERDELQASHDKLTVALENSQTEVKELKHQNVLLEEVKSTLAQENEEKREVIEKYLDNIENLTSSNTALVLQEGRSRSKILALLQGLESLKDCVIQLKEEKKDLQLQIIENGVELAGTMSNCVSGLEKVLISLEKGKNNRIEKETQVCIDADKLDKDTQCGDVQSVDSILAQLEESNKSVESLKSRISELQRENKANEIGHDAITGVQISEQIVNGGGKPSDCAGCVSLQTQVEALSAELDSVRVYLQRSESERDDAVEERNELRREAKYLKYVLSYREDVQSLQVTNQQSKELEKLGSNLVEAEKKVIDLEDEVGRLQEEKQTLLLSILNLYSGHEVEDVREEDEEEEEEEEEEEVEYTVSENKEEDKERGNNENGNEVFAKFPSNGLSPRTPDSAASRREQLKFRFQLSLSESEYSYSSERTEGEDESDNEEVDSPTVLNLQAIKTENKQLKSSLFEANEEKEELLSSLDKLCEEYDSLKDSYDKLEEEYSRESDKAKNDKIALQARLDQIEVERENMRDTLRQIQDEKLSLLGCLEMRNIEAQPLSPMTNLELEKIIARAQSYTREEGESDQSTSMQNLDLENIIARAQSFTKEENNSSEPTSVPNVELDKIIARAQAFAQEENESSEATSVPNVEMDKIIARAQAFAREDNKSSEPTSNEEYSDASLSSEDEDDAGEQTYSKGRRQKTPDNRVAAETQVTHSTPEDRGLASLVDAMENDLRKVKEWIYKRDTDASGEGQEPKPRKPPPGARILKRQASTVKSNLDRVYREKQHLQEEVESLRQYLLKRRDSAMDLRRRRSRGSMRKDNTLEVENRLEGIKTLQVLLGKSDDQLRQSNEIISRLEALNDETEEKLRDSELLQDDLRHAVRTANNIAMEEQQKAEELALQNEELRKQIEALNRSPKDKNDSSAKGKSKFQPKGSKAFNRSVSEDDYEDDESNFTTEGESDFYSSRHSSIASESEFVRSPRSPSDGENMDTLSRDMNSNVLSLSAEESTKSQDTENEGTSQRSSAVDSSDSDDDKE